jgi:hypothetical protein
MENAMFFNTLAPMGKTRNTVYKSFVIVKKTSAKNGHMC